ncbi:MAG TPA: ROK family protein [Rectinemataceae bacterium]|nr:ROK family protein [Rectinemataceae bacterium]
MARVLCGVDLGGTKLGIGLVGPDGHMLDQAISRDHVSLEPEGIVEAMAEGIRGLLRKQGLVEADLLGIGVGTAGHLRHRDGVVITMSNLEGWKGFPLRARLGSHFPSTKVAVDNDANAQALGEYLHGAGSGSSSMVFMTISTQIGAGIILDGRLFRGQTGSAGEIGHTIVDPNSDLLCPCGNHGCLIALASGVAIPGALRRLLLAGYSSQFVDLATLGEKRLDGEFVARGLEAGDPLCRELAADFARSIGIGVYNIFQVFNPERVVLGGGLMNWGDAFLEGIRERVRELARDMMSEEMPIVAASLEAPGIVGAASLILEA